MIRIYACHVPTQEHIELDIFEAREVAEALVECMMDNDVFSEIYVEEDITKRWEL